MTDDRRGMRRREEYAQATRQAIVDAARRLFSERGYFCVKVDEIAALARVAPATVYAPARAGARSYQSHPPGSVPVSRKHVVERSRTSASFLPTLAAQAFRPYCLYNEKDSDCRAQQAESSDIMRRRQTIEAEQPCHNDRSQSAED